MTKAWFSLVVLAFLLLATMRSTGQQTALLKQLNETTPAVPMSLDEISQLDDPLFVLALRGPSLPDNLTSLEQKLLGGGSASEQTFVVSEQIADQAPGQRRMVIAFTGTSGGRPLAGNVMLSVFFDANSFNEEVEGIEGWGWDDSHRRYNYYKFAQSPGRNRRVWTLRGTSDDVASSAASRRGTCLGCHRNGAPIMKELLLPWDNWNSFKFQAAYLRPSSGPARWAVSIHDRLTKLGGAESLESSIMSSISRFNRKRIDSVRPPDDSPFVVRNAKEVLRPLFATTEFNIISADVESGMHPFRSPQRGQPSSDVTVPGSFFLNQKLISAALNVSNVNFGTIGVITPAEYALLVRNSQTRLNGQVGDAFFAWLTPESSHIDDDYVIQLLGAGIISRKFLAAVMSIDLELPMLSPRRESLIRFIPDSFQVSRNEGDQLTALVVDALRIANQPPDSTPGQLLTALLAVDPIDVLRVRVEQYRERVATALSNPATRQVELQRLYTALLERRRSILNHPDLAVLDETDGLLFPMPR